ncbi:MAG TPA: hypothetical protein VK901_19150 [Nitrospiraceae bacterium]|nr:hypothetical protein [Nitrospiraceae bacterium]
MGLLDGSATAPNLGELREKSRRIGQFPMQPLLAKHGTGLCKLRAECDLLSGVTKLAKQHSSVPRHPINDGEYLSPTEIGKVREHLI